MPSAERTIVINQPAARVFDYLANGERVTEWRSGVLEIEKLPAADGAAYRQVVKGPGGRHISADFEFTELTYPTRIAFRTISGPVRPVGSYDLTETDGKTAVTFKLSADIGGWKKWLMGGQVQKTMNAEMAALDKLKAVLES